METIRNPAGYPHCLICSSSVTIPDQDDDDQSAIIFLLATLLEIPENEVVHQQEKLINEQLNPSYCESCKNLISSAKQVYTQILELTQTFRKVQKRIVQKISNTQFLHLGGTPSSTSNHHELLDFCRNFLTNHDFNNFGYPFVVKEKSIKDGPLLLPSSTEYKEDDPPPPNVKAEPNSENEDDDDDHGMGNDDDYQAVEYASAILAEDDDQNRNDSDSDFEPPPSKKPAKKSPVKKPCSSSPQKKPRNRKSASSEQQPPHRKKPMAPKKESRFDLLYPNYPKRLQDPITKKFHCLEPFCSKIYPRKNALEAHIIIQHLQDNFFKCSEPSCGKSYAQSEHFKDHVSWHAGIPRWKCEEKVPSPDGQTVQCTEQFFARKKLNRHVQMMHQSDKSFICEICGNNFSCQDYLTTHKYTKHKNDNPKEDKSEQGVEGNLICNYCGKTFNVQASLKVHINLVHEKTVGKFGCQFCECKFIAKICLKKHLFLKHQFSLDGYKLTRQKSKVVEMAYQCEVKGCRTPFQKEKSLRKHMKEKHGEGKEGEGAFFEFNCKYCGKGFHLRRGLDNHEKVHENKESKPFSCEICGKGFAILRYLKMHIGNVHKEKGEKKRKE